MTEDHIRRLAAALREKAALMGHDVPLDVVVQIVVDADLASHNEHVLRAFIGDEP